MDKFRQFILRDIYFILSSAVFFFVSINIETNLKNTEYIEGKVTSIKTANVKSFRDIFLSSSKYYNVCIKNNAKDRCIKVIEPNMGFEPIVQFLSKTFRIYKALVYEDEQKTKIVKFYSGNDAEIVKYSLNELWLYKYSTLILAIVFFWLAVKKRKVI